MNNEFINRLRGVAVGAAIGDALGMPLEFMSRREQPNLVTEMLPGRIEAGSFTDDTEMALALADSLLAYNPLNPVDLSNRFVKWMQSHPSDIGMHTRAVLSRLATGVPWNKAAQSVQQANPESAGNGSVMRCWPVALARWRNINTLVQESRMQSDITHLHPECAAACAFINVVIWHLLQDVTPSQAISQSMRKVKLSPAVQNVITEAKNKTPDRLPNTGWVRHSLESAVWAILTTDNFEDALINAINLGNDADTTGTVVGALAGAAYGMDAIPSGWIARLHGIYPLQSNKVWSAVSFAYLAESLPKVV